MSSSNVKAGIRLSPPNKKYEALVSVLGSNLKMKVSFVDVKMADPYKTRLVLALSHHRWPFQYESVILLLMAVVPLPAWNP